MDKVSSDQELADIVFKEDTQSTSTTFTAPDPEPESNSLPIAVRVDFESELLGLMRAQNKMIRDIRTCAVFFALTTIVLFFLGWLIGAIR